MSRRLDRRALLVLAGVFALTVSCDSSDNGPTGPSGNSQNETLSITLSPDSAEVFAGIGTQSYTATVRDAAGNPVPSAVVTWTSSSQATLSPAQGLTTTATGVSAGRATITATSGSASKTAVLMVRGASAPPALSPRTIYVATNSQVSQTAPGLLAGANLGTPAATIVSFGGGVLGGNSTTYAAGQTATFDVPVTAPGRAGAASASQAAQGGMVVNADGSFTINPPLGFDGSLTFQFRVGNIAGSVDGTVNVGVDAPPTVLATSPADGTVGVGTVGSIAITFSEPVSAQTSAFRLECPSGTSMGVGMSGSGTNQLTLTPSSQLPRGVTCRVTVTGAQVRDSDTDDGPDSMAADYSFGFSMEAAVLPRASADEYGVKAGETRIVAAPGVLGNDNLGSPPGTLTSFGGGDLGGSVTSHQPGASVPLAGGTVRLNADGSLVISGLREAGEYSFLYRVTSSGGTADASVTVELTLQDAPPVVSWSSPANGATGVATGTAISVYFSEEVVAAAGAFALECPVGNARAFTISGSGSAAIVLTPSLPLPANTTCVVRVLATGGLIHDVDSNDPPDLFEDDYQFSFSVGTAPVPVNDSYLTAINTPLSVVPPGVLGNDALGAPAGTVTSFGGGSLGGSVTSFPAGAVVPFGPFGTAQLTANGALSVTPLNGFTGTVTFSYRLANVVGFADATVTVRVEGPPTVLSTTPTNGAANVASNSNLTVAFSEPVAVFGNWAQAACTTSGVRNAADFAISGGPTSYTLDAFADFASGETCTVTVFAANVVDLDTDDPPDNMAASYVFSFTVDAAPSLLFTNPANGAVGVPSSLPIQVNFSEPVNVTGNWFRLVCGVDTRLTSNFIVAGGPTNYTLIPVTAYPQGLCSATVFAALVTDQDSADPPDNPQTDYLFSFTVEAAPSVQSTSPANGAANVAANANLSITFSEPVFVGSFPTFNCSVSGILTAANFVPGGGPTTYTLDPIADFAGGETCVGTILASSVTDFDANDPPDNMAADFNFSFTIDAAPSVLSTSPVNGSGNVPANSNLSITFSEPVFVANPPTFNCTTSGILTIANFTPSGGPVTYVLDPINDFAPGETCTGTILAADVTDMDANDPPNNMAANFNFSFTIDAAPAETAQLDLGAWSRVAVPLRLGEGGSTLVGQAARSAPALGLAFGTDPFQRKASRARRSGDLTSGSRELDRRGSLPPPLPGAATGAATVG